MGIYERDYYRREGPSFLGSLVERGTVCKWLIAINIVCFLIQMVTKTPVAGPRGPFDEPFTQALWLDVDKVMEGQVWRLLTCAFLHSTEGFPMHILFNMLFLWWFGQQVEEDYGPREFLGFYLLAAVISSVVFCAAHEVGLHRGVALGASGAVMAVTVLFALHYPRQVIYLFFFLPIPIWGFVVFMVLNDAVGLLGKTKNGIATSAHLGGAAFAFAYYKSHLQLTSWLGSVPSWRRRRRSPNLRIYRDDEPATPVSVAAPASSLELEQLREEVDLILEKISLVGKENLTEHERQVLLRASEVLKRQRG